MLRCVVTAAAEQLYPYHETPALSGHRRRLLQRAGGDVLDLSSRWVANRACYVPGTLTSLTVLGPQAPATRPPEWADDPVTDDPVVLGAGLDGLARTGGSYDTIVATLALCTAGDLDAALAGVAAWMRPDGQLLVLEHVRGTGLTGLAQAVAAPYVRAIGSGCHLDQQLAPALRRHGLDLTDCARFTARIAGGLPTPFVAGVVRHRPGAARRQAPGGAVTSSPGAP